MTSAAPTRLRRADLESSRRARPGATAPSPGALVLISTFVFACAGPQSTLDPAGRGAEQIAELGGWMIGGTALIWAAVMGLTAHIAVRRRAWSPRAPTLLIVVGGVILPVIVLTGLLIWGLALLPPLLAPADGGPTIVVTGEQYWWRVLYRMDGQEVALANELRLPIGRPIQLELESHDVLHSLWIPALAGKVDMIPGRRTRLRLEPTRVGVYRGVCAEYCGTSHARMAFAVVVADEREFAGWLAHQAEPARPPAGALAARGAALFVDNGCGACHTIRGTIADGVVGPDLTHVGSRRSVGAGLLRNDPEHLQRWISEPERLKPGVHMPAFSMLPAADRRALAVYLEGLQ